MMNNTEMKAMMKELLMECLKEMNTPEVATAEATDKPKSAKKHAIEQAINLVWNTESMSLQLKAVNSQKVIKDLWTANYEFLKSQYNASYSKTKGIFWYKKDEASFHKARAEFKVITCLDVEAQIELEHSKIEKYHAQIENLEKLIKESEAKLNKLKNL